MNTKLKLLSFFLVVVLVFTGATVFSACNDSGYDADNFIEDVNSEKIVKEKITLRIFVPRSQQHLQDWNKMRLFKELEAETNIAVEFLYGDTSSYANQKSSAWTSRNKPDAFFLWNTVMEQTTEASLGTIRPLDELIELYAPNYKALMEADPQIEKEARLLDGKMYSTVTINTVPRDWTFKQYINVKWIYQALVNEQLSLSDLGLTTLPDYDDEEERKLLLPSDTEQFYKVLKAFKAMGKTPLSSIGYSSTLRRFLTSAFGYVTSGITLDENDRVIFVQNTENYREYLKYANKLFSEGLLDNTIFANQSESAFYDKADNLGCFDASSAYSIVGAARDDDYMALPPLTSPVNSQKVWTDFDNKYDATTLMIPTSTPYYREVMRWIDRLYSEKYRKMQAFGKEGEDWQWDNEEKTSFTFNVPDGQSIEQFRGTITPGVGLGQVTYWDGDFVLKENNPVTQKINKETKTYLPYLKVAFPKVKFTSKESESLALLTTGLNTTTSDFEKLAVTGDKSGDVTSDDVWNSFQSSLNKSRLSEYIEIYKAAYERYKAA